MKKLTFYMLAFVATPAFAQMSDYDRGYAQGHSAGYTQGFVDGSGKGANPQPSRFPFGNSNGMEIPEYLAIILDRNSGEYQISNSNAVPVFGEIDWSQDEIWQKVMSAGEGTGWVDPEAIMIVPRGVLSLEQEQSKFQIWTPQTGATQSMLGATAEVVPMLRGLTYSVADPVFPVFELTQE